jgi:hypothetical protein
MYTLYLCYIEVSRRVCYKLYIRKVACKSIESILHVLTLFRSAKHSTRTVAVPSAQGRTVRAQGPDGPRPGARRGGALCARADCPRPGARLGLLPDGRTVRTYAGTAEDRRRRLDLAPGRDPVGE